MLKNIFTSYLYEKKLDINLKDLYEHVLDVKRKGQDGLFLTKRSGWHSKIFNERNIFNRQLFNNIDLMVEEVKNQTGQNIDLKLDNYWYNVNQNGSYHIPHNHVTLKNSVIMSGVFYIQTTSNSGNLIFRRNNPLVSLVFDKNNTSNFNEYNSTTWMIEPVNNYCVLFPSYLEHYVEPNNSNENRISMSFNYRYTQNSYK
tara:strand:- start:83 stop:682 length:600 start_codon:yes stop_codon:yes gene_type:complete